MMAQSFFVVVLALVLYFIVIGISDIKFQENIFSNLMCLTTFNDNQEELEAKLMMLGTNTNERIRQL